MQQGEDLIPQDLARVVTLEWARSALGCPYHFFQRFVRQFPASSTVVPALAIGKAFGFSVHEVLDLRAEGQQIEGPDVAEIFRERFMHVVDTWYGKIKVRHDKPKATLDESILDQGIRMTVAWWDRWGKTLEPVKVNQTFELRFKETREYGDDWTLVGTVPTICKRPDTGEVVLAIPIVTDRQWSERRFRNDPTAAFYCLGARESGIHHALGANLQIVYWQDGKVRLQDLNPQVSDQDINGMLRRIQAARRQVMDACWSEGWLPNRWADFCSRALCRFHKPCTADYGGEVA